MTITLTEEAVVELAREQQLHDTDLLVEYFKHFGVPPDASAHELAYFAEVFYEAYPRIFSRECATQWEFVQHDTAMEFRTTFTKESFTRWLHDLDIAIVSEVSA